MLAQLDVWTLRVTWNPAVSRFIVSWWIIFMLVLPWLLIWQDTFDAIIFKMHFEGMDTRKTKTTVAEANGNPNN